MGIQLKVVACNNCGASLSIQEQTRFVTCAHCGSQLAVHRTDGSAFTEQLTEIGNHTQQIATDLTALRGQAELENLEREWQLFKRDFSGAIGQEPDATVAVIAGVCIGAVGVFAAVMISSSFPKETGWFPLMLATAAVGAGIAIGMYEYSRALNYANVKRIYRRKRAALREKYNIGSTSCCGEIS